MKLIARCSLGLIVASTIASNDSQATACPDTAFFGCPCHWDLDTIPVYANTVGTAEPSLRSLTPLRSAAEWERIITNALNIYREHSGIARRLKFVAASGFRVALRRGVMDAAEPT